MSGNVIFGVGDVDFHEYSDHEDGHEDSNKEGEHISDVRVNDGHAEGEGQITFSHITDPNGGLDQSHVQQTQLLSAKKGFIKYCESTKGKALFQGSSEVYCLALVIFAFSILLSDLLPNEILSNVADRFYVVIYSMAIVSIVVLLALGSLEQFTHEKLPPKQKKNNFVRGGMLVMGSGAMIYYSIVLSVDSILPATCKHFLFTFRSALGLVFVALQIVFLMKYSTLRINKNVWVCFGSCFLLMQIAATNGAVWLRTVAEESIRDITSVLREEEDDPINQTATPEKTICDNSDLDDVMRPYLFPLLVQFCVLATTMLLAIWEKCEPANSSKSNDPKASRTVSFADLTYFGEEITCNEDKSLEYRLFSGGQLTSCEWGEGSNPTQKSGNYHNTNFGFILGWLVLMTTIVITIVCAYDAYVMARYRETVEIIVYSSIIVLNALCLVSIPRGMWKMSVLTFKDERIKVIFGSNHEKQTKITRKVNLHVLRTTFIFLMSFKVMTLIAAYDQHNAMLYADGISSIAMGYMQCLFISWYAYKKRTTTEEHHKTRPGRQELEFLRMVNFSLWLVNIFLLKHPHANIQEETFGNVAWTIISKLLQPLTILFYFQSMMCYAEVIVHSFSTKYIGLARLEQVASRSFTLE